YVVVAEVGAAGRQTKLVEGEVLPHAHRERERNHFEEHRTVVSVGDLVEAIALVSDDAGEHVDATGRALRVRLAAYACGQRNAFLERHEVRALGLEHDAVLAEVELVDDVVLYALLDALASRQETAPDTVRDLSEAQVEARGLHVLVGNRERSR